MKVHRILVVAFGAAGAVAVVLAAAAFATPSSGLASQLLGRGTAQDDFYLSLGDPARGREAAVRCGSGSRCDVAVVRATLEPGGFTGWHSHPMPSLVVVRAGTLTMLEPKGGRCASRTFTAGQAFVHPAGLHNFVNPGTTQLEFFVAYFAPPAAGLLIDGPAAPECA
jgi:hypothetical protein